MPKADSPRRPLALTMGEPAGVGPLLALQAWAMRETRAIPPFVYVGDPAALLLHDRSAELKEVADFEKAEKVFQKALPVYPVKCETGIMAGEPNPDNGKAVLKSIEVAAKAALDKKVMGVVTNPIHKKTLMEAGFSHPGHTDYLGELTDSRPVMMLANKYIRTVPVTVHIPLKDVSKKLKKADIVKIGEIVNRDLMERFGFEKPLLCITGLNPHSGEQGALGSEEEDIIAPAIKTLQRKGIFIEGPFPGDTAFSDDMRRKYDCFLAMTHDQALIPVKTLDFRGAVNITLGLPLIRTSPAHGTAFQVVREGRLADPESLIQALLMAFHLYKGKA